MGYLDRVAGAIGIKRKHDGESISRPLKFAKLEDSGATNNGRVVKQAKRSAIPLTSSHPKDYCVNGVPLDSKAARNITIGGSQAVSSYFGDGWCQWQTRPDGTIEPTVLFRGSEVLPLAPQFVQKRSNGTCPAAQGEAPWVEVGKTYSPYNQPNDCLYHDPSSPVPVLSEAQFRNLSAELKNVRDGFDLTPSPSPTPTPSLSNSDISTSSPVGIVAGLTTVATGILSTAAAYITPTPTAAIAATAPSAAITGAAAGAAIVGAGVVIAGAGYGAYKFGNWLCSNPFQNSGNSIEDAIAIDRMQATPSAPLMEDVIAIRNEQIREAWREGRLGCHMIEGISPQEFREIVGLNDAAFNLVVETPKAQESQL